MRVVKAALVQLFFHFNILNGAWSHRAGRQSEEKMNMTGTHVGSFSTQSLQFTTVGPCRKSWRLPGEATLTPVPDCKENEIRVPVGVREAWALLLPSPARWAKRAAKMSESNNGAWPTPRSKEQTWLLFTSAHLVQLSLVASLLRDM